MPSGPQNPPKPPSKRAPGGKASDPRPADPRQERLAQALRDNLKKRKAQQRQRRQGGGPGDGSRRGQS